MKHLEREFVKEFRELLQPMKKEIRAQMEIKRNPRHIVKEVFAKYDLSNNFKKILLDKLTRALNGDRIIHTNRATGNREYGP